MMNPPTKVTTITAGFLSVAFLSAPIFSQPRIKVAVYPFDQSSVQANVQKEVGGNVNYGQVASDLLVTELSQQMDVVNRDQMKRLLEEQGHKYDENFDKNQAAETGKLLGVDAIVTGSITSLNAEQTASGGIGKSIGTLIKKGPKVDESSTTVTVNVDVVAQAVSVATGKTLAAHGTGSVKKTLHNKLNVNNQTSGGDTTSKSGFDPYVRDALALALKDVAAQLASLTSTPHAESGAKPAAAPAAGEYVALPNEVGNVAKLSGETLVFFLAPDAHVAAGDVLEVQSLELSTNPRTGKQVAIGETLGTLQVQSVTGDQARAKYTGKPVTDKDRVVKKAGH